MSRPTPSQRVALGLDEPSDFTHTGEFLPAGAPLNPNGGPIPGAGDLSALPNSQRFSPRLVLKQAEKATAPKIRQLVNELLAENLQNADYALKQLFAANPKAALELYIELSKFSLPQLKAVAVAVEDNSGNPNARAMSFGQLQALLTGGE